MHRLLFCCEPNKSSSTKAADTICMPRPESGSLPVSPVASCANLRAGPDAGVIGKHFSPEPDTMIVTTRFAIAPARLSLK